MKADGLYSRADWIRAVNLAAAIGWAAVVLPELLVEAVRTGQFGQASAWLILSALVGLPIAFAASWAIGGPTLRFVMQRPLSWMRAAIWGGVIAAGMKALAIAFGQLRLWQARQSRSSFSFGDGNGQIISDNMRTAYGWGLVAEDTVYFILAGVFVALLVRHAIGPGRPSKLTDE